VAFDPDAQCQTVDDWLRLARTRRSAARQILRGNQALATIAWEQTGFAAEALIKAAIMCAHQQAIWWTKAERKDVWSHDLRALSKLIGVTEEALPPTDPYAPAWKVVFDWRREHGYNISSMPDAVAKGLDEAVFWAKRNRGMDLKELPNQYLAAGREYLGRLKGLGLEPEGLFWVRADLGYDPDAKPVPGTPWAEDSEWRLFLATSIYDEAGPLVLQRLLFRAYNASLTPKEISPFIVQVMSPKTAQFQALANALRRDSPMLAMVATTEDGRTVNIPTDGGATEVKIGDLIASGPWVYVLSGYRPNLKSRAAQFRAFRSNIERLAA
jgi:hypothetical protein